MPERHVKIATYTGSSVFQTAPLSGSAIRYTTETRKSEKRSIKKKTVRCKIVCLSLGENLLNRIEKFKLGKFINVTAGGKTKLCF